VVDANGEVTVDNKGKPAVITAAMLAERRALNMTPYVTENACSLYYIYGSADETCKIYNMDLYVTNSGASCRKAVTIPDADHNFRHHTPQLIETVNAIIYEVRQVNASL
jgi:alpha/beta superfamily hydrolase